MVKRNTPGRWIASTLAALFLCATVAAEEDSYYKLVTYPLPKDLVLEVSGLAMLPDGRLAVAIRKGEIWILDRMDDPAKTTFRPYAKGLHEPLGLTWHDGDLYTVQRTELTRLRDRNGDGQADEYWTVANMWGVTGNYHEYAYGPVFDRDGHAWVTLNCTLGKAVDRRFDAWRGWSLKIAPDGSWTPVTAGFRSPAGLGLNARGDVFATDQQGNWFPTCALVHLQPGTFHGHQDALKHGARPEAPFRVTGPAPEPMTVVEAARQVPHYRLPAVWFPYRKMGMSTTDLVCDETGGRFGPFEGQLFVGEFTMSLVTRVFLEQVDGQYQGACFRFRDGLQCAALRLAFAPDGSLFVGQSNRGWNSLGNRSYGLQRVVWTGKTPFEIQEMRARPDGFRLRFTLPLDRKTAGERGNYRFESYTYQLHQAYGSPELDRQKLEVTNVTISPGGREVDLVVEGLREGYVHELKVEGVRSSDGLKVVHPLACYTLNRIPAGVSP